MNKGLLYTNDLKKETKFITANTAHYTVGLESLRILI